MDKLTFIRNMAEADYEVGHTFDPDDFRYFKKVCAEDGVKVTEEDFAKYFEMLDEIRAGINECSNKDSINLTESLMQLDSATYNMYDLYNSYVAANLSVEKKAVLAEMLRNKSHISKLYHFLNEAFYNLDDEVVVKTDALEDLREDINEAGSESNYAEELKKKIAELNAWIADLEDERSYVNRGGNYDSQAEIDEDIEYAEKQIKELEDKLSRIEE